MSRTSALYLPKSIIPLTMNSQKKSTQDQIQHHIDTAKAIMRAADLLTDKEERQKLMQVATSQLATAEKLSRKRNPGYISELPKDARASEIKKARLSSAVRQGEKVYLPIRLSTSVAFPNILLRSSLFSASKVGDILESHSLSAHGDVDIETDGPQLGDYDRRVFGAMLQHYQEGETELGAIWLNTTLSKIAKQMLARYGKQTYAAIKSSLERMNDVRLKIKIKGHPLPTLRLVEVRIDRHEGDLDSFKKTQVGNTNISFRVSEDMAMLFGRAEWTAISSRTLNDEEGLKAWLCMFYATHREPWPFEIQDLYKKSGSKGDLTDFRRRLADRLLELQDENVPIEHRVAGFQRQKDKITVCLSRWESGYKKPRK